jgi:hypothetical protein
MITIEHHNHQQWTLLQNPRAAHLVSSDRFAVSEYLATRCEGHDSLEVAAAVVGQRAIDEACSHGRRAWLFVADYPWQSPSQMLRRSGLWGRRDPMIAALAAQAANKVEVIVESESKWRYAGAVDISVRHIDETIRFARTHRASAIFCSKRINVAIDATSFVRELFTAAFLQKDDSYSLDILWWQLADEVCSRGDALIRIFGEFDDREAVAEVIELATR